ncbi:hypothetical protein Pla144_50220 [Bythopirellula polymerisocia]|uniref:Uncharacterized protein n=1 Tax=Bythopirellula polymerisocia TaxID=2528003 RepID=A0A5C6CB68_9BACT|nr:hypothetical protein Pla144_50220 [Bythopirellula polymerisocia]
MTAYTAFVIKIMAEGSPYSYSTFHKLLTQNTLSAKRSCQSDVSILLLILPFDSI